MTALPEIDFLYLCRKVGFENSYRKHFAFAKIIKLIKKEPHIFQLSVICPHCKFKEDNLQIDISQGNKLVCSHCYQRFFINAADVRFGNISQIYQYCYLYVKKIILCSHKVHRFTYMLPGIIEKTAAISRRIITLISKIRLFKKYDFQVARK